ncbi:MAG: lamin tail domain-containing protein, partial [Verrucomicrobiota bacterium]
MLRDEVRARDWTRDSVRFYTPSAPSKGEPNVVDFDDRVVINEIMYHAPPSYIGSDDPESAFVENDEEWIELYNRSNESIDLEGWSIREGLAFEFEAGAVLPPNGFLVVAKQAESLRQTYPDVAVVGEFEGTLGNQSDRLELRDASGNPVDQVRYYDGRPWPDLADAGGSSLELRHPDLDNAVAGAWAASDETRKSEWRRYSYRATAIRPTYTAGVRNFHELRVGMIQAGSCLIDNVSVKQDPDGGGRELLKNRTFGSLFAPITSGNWQLIGTHEDSEAIDDPEAGSVLKIVADGPMNYLNNLCEANLNAPVETGLEYEISFDARWLGGSPQLRTEIYYNKLAKTTILDVPEALGTPGRRNSRWDPTPGPVYSGLVHSPAVPEADEAVTVSVDVLEAGSLEEVRLFYSVDEADWQSIAMTGAGGPRFEGVIPGQANRTVVQFYVEARNGAGGVSLHPTDGPDSGAFVKFETPVGSDRRQVLRLITRDSDAVRIHASDNILSNRRHDCTTIVNETEIHYDCGVRLRGS